jgi:pimeloyl-ACP methyl ester carboxylesterase
MGSAVAATGIAALLGYWALRRRPGRPLTRAEITELKRDRQFATIDSLTTNGVTLKGLQVHFEMRGANPLSTVLLLHGVGASTYTWSGTMEALAPHHAVIALDLPGFGLSDRPRDFAYTMDAYADVVIAFLNAMDIERVHLVGHSLGGGVALRTTLKAPGRVRSLTLIESLGYAFQAPLMLRLAARWWRILKPFSGEFATRMLLRDAVANTRILTPERVKNYALPMRLPGEFGLARAIHADSPEQVRKDEKHIREVHAPTLIIWGEEDGWVPPRFARRFLTDIAGSELLLVPNAGHLVHEEHPDAVNGRLASFLDRVTGLTPPVSPTH